MACAATALGLCSTTLIAPQRGDGRKQAVSALRDARALISTVRSLLANARPMWHSTLNLVFSPNITNGKVRVPMLILSEFDIRFQLPAPAAMVAVLHLHPSIESRLRTGNELLIERSTADVPESTDYPRTIVPYREYFDSFGNRCARFVARAGYLRLSNASVIDADPEP